MESQKREQGLRATLAALLHDVGKLAQRAGETSEGGRSHPALGEKFVQQYVPSQWQALCAPVAWHHGNLSERGLTTKIVALADRLSAGERERKDGEESRVKHLESPFGTLEVGGKRGSPAYVPLRPLSLDDGIFPKSSPPDGAEEDHRLLWQGFCGEMAALQREFRTSDDLESYLVSVAGVLKKYTWCVPSAFYYDRPDVSLYDHLRTTAALAACFAQTWSGAEGERAVDDLLESIRGVEPAQWPSQGGVAGLLAGDISGIQSFIYGLHHARRAGAALRARSFYVQLLTEAAARRTLRELQLPVTNTLYLGGGGFTLIVPPTAGSSLLAVARAVNDVLLQAHQGKLYLALAFVPLVPRDFGLGIGGGESPLARRWMDLQLQLEQRKERRFSELAPERLQTLFAPRGSGTGIVCAVCGGESSSPEPDEEGLMWCRSCQSLAKLGLDLRRAKYLLLADVPEAPLPPEPGWQDVMRALGVRAEVGEEEPALPPGTGRHELLSFVPATPPFAPGRAVAYRPLVNTVPLVQQGEEVRYRGERPPEPGDIKHFGVLAQQSQGAPYLGVLRMDMDNLGRIFATGLGGRDTLSRRATLSFHLSLFFEGWVGEIARRVDEGGLQRLYAVYSGGDDLFFVGSWDAVIKFAQLVRADLARFTSRDDLGISGGIVLVHEKFPLAVAAERAHEAESAAKRLRPNKDTLAFLETPVPWERFGYGDGAAETVAAWAEWFQRLVEEEGAPRALIRRVQDFLLTYETGGKGRGGWGPWVWRAAYTFARAAERAPEDLREEIRQLGEFLAGERFAKNIRWLALAARWAELATRTEEEG